MNPYWAILIPLEACSQRAAPNSALTKCLSEEIPALTFAEPDPLLAQQLSEQDDLFAMKQDIKTSFEGGPYTSYVVISCA